MYKLPHKLDLCTGPLCMACVLNVCHCVYVYSYNHGNKLLDKRQNLRESSIS